eukprot:maker-scaffold_5-snap-gene-15.7-mRNA-1 protein AED:0.00 eAED:0.00 QI:167/1/1/1/0/0.5/2/125/88
MPNAAMARKRSNKKFQKPGVNTITPPKEDQGPKIGLGVIALLVFVVLGSAVVEILRALDNQQQNLAQQQQAQPIPDDFQFEDVEQPEM